MSVVSKLLEQSTPEQKDRALRTFFTFSNIFIGEGHLNPESVALMVACAMRELDGTPSEEILGIEDPTEMMNKATDGIMALKLRMGAKS